VTKNAAGKEQQNKLQTKNDKKGFYEQRCRQRTTNKAATKQAAGKE